MNLMKFVLNFISFRERPEKFPALLIMTNIIERQPHLTSKLNITRLGKIARAKVREAID